MSQPSFQIREAYGSLASKQTIVSLDTHQTSSRWILSNSLTGPGSCLFLFEGPQTVNAGDSVYKSHYVGSTRTFRYLHCGDFRASPRHVLHPAVKGKRIDHVYLDTTYLDPKYTFPPQPLVISACAELARRIVGGHSTTNGEGVVNNKARTMEQFVAGPEKSPESKKVGKILVVVG